MTTPSTRSTGPACPACGAARITSAAVPCWLCGAMLPAYHSPLLRNRASFGTQAPVNGTVADKPGFVTLGILFVVLLGLSMATFVEVPGLAILLALLALPCLLRTI